MNPTWDKTARPIFFATNQPLFQHVPTNTWVKGYFCFYSLSYCDKSQPGPWRSLFRSTCAVLPGSYTLFVDDKAGIPRLLLSKRNIGARACVCVCLHSNTMIISAWHVKYAGVGAFTRKHFILSIAASRERGNSEKNSKGGKCKHRVQIDECKAALYKSVPFSWGSVVGGGEGWYNTLGAWERRIALADCQNTWHVATRHICTWMCSHGLCIA